MQSHFGFIYYQVVTKEQQRFVLLLGLACSALIDRGFRYTKGSHSQLYDIMNDIC